MNPQQASAHTRAKLSHQAYLLASALAVTALTYAGTLRFDFVSDDNLQIADNPFIKSWRYAPRFFVTSVWAHLLPNSPHNYYRPLYLFWNLVNYSLFGLRPAGWHATSILLHLLVTALVYGLVRKLVPGRPNLAWLTALIFGVHPIHHEVVAWVSGATESLYATFFLGSFLAYCYARSRNGVAHRISHRLGHRIGHRIGWMCLSCLLYGLALFTKETAIILPALVFAHAWLVGGDADPAQPRSSVARLRQAAGIALIYAPVVAIYLLMRFRVLSAFGHIRVSISVADLLFTWPSVLLFYLKHWFVPFGYSAYYDMAYFHGFNLAGVVLPALLLVGFGGALWLARRPLGRREIAHAAAWMILPLLPALDLGVFPLHELAHDRYFYVPSIGAALLIALLLEAIAKNGPLVWGQPSRLLTTALLLTAVLSFFTAIAANQWANDLTLLTRAREFAPRNFSVRNDLSAQWIDQGHLDDAQALLEPLVQEAPQDWMAWLNLARVRYQKQNYAQAEADLRRTIALNPDSAVAYVLLGQAQLKTDTLQAALSSVQQGVQLLPDEYRFRVIYGALLQANGDCHNAVKEFLAALVLHPGEIIAQRGMSLCRGPSNPTPVANAGSLSR